MAQERAPGPDEIKLQLDIRRQEVHKPLLSLQAKYDQALAQLEKSEQAKGNPEAVIEIQKERQEFASRTAKSGQQASLARLTELIRVYDRESSRIRSEIRRKEATVLSAYITTVKQATKELTKEGRLEEAQRCVQIREEIEGMILALKNGSATPKVSGEEETVILAPGIRRYDLDDRCESDRDGDRIAFTTNVGNAPLRSRKSFSTPFRIEARAEAQGQLRFYFGESGVVFFNWNMNASELRIGDPKTTLSDQSGFKGEGLLPPGSTFDLAISVEADAITVSVDGKMRAKMAGNFEDTEGPIGVGPSAGSTTVHRLPEELENQLKEGGRVAAIFMDGALGTCRIGQKVDGRLSWRFAFNATAPILPGCQGAPSFQF